MDTDSIEPAHDTPADPGQKYIRTFAGDMEVAKQGGKPDLTPLMPRKEQDTTPVEAAEPTPAPVPDAWDAQKREETLARLHAKAAEDAASSVPRSDERPEPLPPEIVSPLHTYSADFSDQVKEQHASRASILAAEQDAGPHEVVAAPEEHTARNLMFAVLGAILFIASGAGIYYAYAAYVVKNTPVAVVQVTTAPIFYDQEEKVSEVGPALLVAITQSVTHPLTAGKVRLLASTNATTTRRSIFVTMQPVAPDILLRNIVGAGSMAGVINTGGSSSPFFILSVTAYNDTFAGMLSWEPTMAKDLSALFVPYASTAVAPPVALPATTTATSTKNSAPKPGGKVATTTKPAATSTPPAPVFVGKFHDEVVANHDVRVYRDALGRSIVLYGYWNQTTLVIAHDTAAFAEILARLANAPTR